MKSSTNIALMLLFAITINCFAQDKIFKEVFSEKFNNDRLKEIHHPNVDVLQRINDIDSLLLKSQNNTWQRALRNPQREFYEEEGFNAKDTRTTINKKQLGDGFLLIELFAQVWDGYAWANYLRYSYIYDGNNNLTEELLQTWDSSAWVNHSKNLYTYDGNNNLTEELRQSGPASEDRWKYSYTYDGNNNLTEEIEQLFDGFVWVNLEKYSYTYDGNNFRTGELRQTGPVWSNVWQYSYTYDGNNNLTEALRQSWNISSWSNSRKYTYTYDGNNSRTELLFQTWDGSAWVDTGKLIYSYIPTDVEEFRGEFNDYSLSNNFPNPFNPTTKIEFRIADFGFVSLKVYDVLGNEVATLVDEYKNAGSNEVEFNASELASGVYIYQLIVGNYLQSKKMILLK